MSKQNEQNDTDLMELEKSEEEGINRAIPEAPGWRDAMTAALHAERAVRAMLDSMPGGREAYLMLDNAQAQRAHIELAAAFHEGHRQATEPYFYAYAGDLEDVLKPISDKHYATIAAASDRAVAACGGQALIGALEDAMGMEEAEMIHAAYRKGLHDGLRQPRRPSLATARAMCQRADWRGVALVAGMALLMLVSLAFCGHGGPFTAGLFGR